MPPEDELRFHTDESYLRRERGRGWGVGVREWSVGGQLRPVFQKISIWQDKEGFANESNYCNNNQPALSYRVHSNNKMQNSLLCDHFIPLHYGSDILLLDS